ncbi:major facilitator superfamily domain-containing protein [Phthorimaea operculella]|nr:major facilitator superfamily domain-containing protein [Phthorimaea operculella]
MDKHKHDVQNRYGLEEALDLTGFGKYNVAMLISCCLVMLAMFLDMFGFSVPLPLAACELSLTTGQQGLLSAMPLIGVMLSSYAWGLCADTLGRRKTLLMAMPVGTFFNVITSFAPSFATLAAFKFLSACFTSSATAAAFVLMGESVSRNYRSRCMFIMASATTSSQFFTSLIALPVFSLSFRENLLGIEYRPWRLLVLLLSLPGLLGTIGVALLHESPKFLLSKKREDEALKVLKKFFELNNYRSKQNCFNVDSLYLDDFTQLKDEDAPKVSFICRMWKQTAPLFKPPLLKNSFIIYYLLLCAYMTATGYTIWIPTITNAYFNGQDNTGKYFCEVASSVAVPKNNTLIDCDNAISSFTLYAVMVYSGASSVVNFLLLFIVKPLGKKGTTLVTFAFCITCGTTLLFVTIPLLSIAMFYLFLYIVVILGNANTYLVELNPTHLRGMATCLSVVVARGFGFISVQLIATFLADHCTPLFIGYLTLVISGFFVAFLLPPDTKLREVAAKTSGIS